MTTKQIQALRAQHTYTEAMILAKTLDKIIPKEAGKDFAKLAKRLQEEHFRPDGIIRALLGSAYSWEAYGN